MNENLSGDEVVNAGHPMEAKGTGLKTQALALQLSGLAAEISLSKSGPIISLPAKRRGRRLGEGA